MIRFNKLLSTVKTSLVNLDKAIDGFLVMSADLEEVYNCVFDNKVPDIWHKVSTLYFNQSSFFYIKGFISFFKTTWFLDQWFCREIKRNVEMDW